MSTIFIRVPRLEASPSGSVNHGDTRFQSDLTDQCLLKALKEKIKKEI